MLSVAIVEDEPAIARAFVRIIRRHAPEVALDIAGSLSEAASEIDSRPRAGLVVELKLPDAGPKQTMSWLADIRARDPMVQILIVSGVKDEDWLVNAVDRVRARRVLKGDRREIEERVASFALDVAERVRGERVLDGALSQVAAEGKFTPALRDLARTAITKPRLNRDGLAAELGKTPGTVKAQIHDLVNRSRVGTLDEFRVEVYRRAVMRRG